MKRITSGDVSSIYHERIFYDSRSIARATDEETIEAKRQREKERCFDLPHRSVERVNGGREEDIGWNGGT